MKIKAGLVAARALRGSAPFLVTAALVLLGAGQAAAAPTLSELGLLSRLTDSEAQLSPSPPGVTVSELSSHDMTGGNVDGGAYDDALGHALPPTYLRTEDGAYVLADERGPGCLARIWMTADSNQVQGNVSSFGNIQLYFDGSSTPAVNEPAATFFAGHDPRFPAPLVNDYLASSGGNYSYVPFCFAHRLEVRVTGALATDMFYFQLTFLHARPGTPVQSFDGYGTEAAQAAVSRLADVGEAPAGAPAQSSSAQLTPGKVAALPTLTGAGAVRYLQIAVKPFDIATLQALALRVSVDGSSQPQIDVPLGDLFGDGIETRPIKSSDFGMDPSTDTGYLALPIPFSRQAKISVASSTATASVSIRAWTGAPVKTSDRLYGQQLITQTKLGQDFPVLGASGSGHLASYVMDLADPGSPLSGESAGQWFMEGDERVDVDGLRSPSIYGTGTEDEFDGGYYFNQGPFTLPFAGAGPLGQTSPTAGGTQSAYRVFGDDGVSWSDGVNYTQQAGGDNERLPETATATTFSYRGPQQLAPSDSVIFGNPASQTAHGLKGTFKPVTLDAYFEGAHDGTIPVSTVVFGGTDYFSPPPQVSNQSYTARGVSFRSPISATLRIPRANQGVVLRRLQDQATPAPVEVTVDGQPAGIWPGAAFQGNPSKRWLEDDYGLPPKLTAGRSRITVTLSPANAAETATAYSLQAFALSSG
jgi:hypothetical protein